MKPRGIRSNLSGSPQQQHECVDFVCFPLIGCVWRGINWMRDKMMLQIFHVRLGRRNRISSTSCTLRYRQKTSNSPLELRVAPCPGLCPRLLFLSAASNCLTCLTLFATLSIRTHLSFLHAVISTGNLLDVEQHRSRHAGSDVGDM